MLMYMALDSITMAFHRSMRLRVVCGSGEAEGGRKFGESCSDAVENRTRLARSSEALPLSTISQRSTNTRAPCRRRRVRAYAPPVSTTHFSTNAAVVLSSRIVLFSFIYVYNYELFVVFFC